MTQESVSYFGSTTTGKTILRLFVDMMDGIGVDVFDCLGY